VVWHVNNIEFKALVKGLFLTQKQVQEIGGYKDQRQIRRFISGEQPPHKDLVEKLLQLDHQIDQACLFSVNKAIESAADAVNVIGYHNEIQYLEWVDDPLPFYELHLCLQFRLKKALKKMAIECHVTPFNADSYLDYIEDNSLEDSQKSMALWAGGSKP